MPQPQLIACEFPMPGRCPNVMEYAGVGRKPKYCQQTVDGLRHVAYTAHRVVNGMVTVPEPGSQPSAPAVGATPLRPVTQVRATAAKLHEQLGNLVDRQLQPLITQLVEAIHIAADPESTRRPRRPRTRTRTPRRRRSRFGSRRRAAGGLQPHRRRRGRR
ncbi:hypothetical protein ACFQV8_00295 [Pseudonocardia benzenivorans]